MKVTQFSGTLITSYQTRRRRTPKDFNLQSLHLQLLASFSAENITIMITEQVFGFRSGAFEVSVILGCVAARLAT